MSKPRMEAIVAPRFSPRAEVIIHHHEQITHEGGFVLNYIERWGMVAGIPDGEDSSGRQKLRLATPKELVDRAMAVTRLAFAALREEGYTVEVPPWDEALKISAEEDARRLENERPTR